MIESDDEKSNVIAAFPQSGIPDNPLKVEPERHDFCSHDTLRIDPHARVVTCGKCRAVLDPFQYLLDNARHLQMAWQHHHSVYAKARELVERVHELSKEEKRLKARVKTLEQKTGDLVSIRGKRTL